MSETYKSALIVGAGSGLSASIARTFAKAGMSVALAARSAAKLDEFVQATGAKAYNCDAAKRDEVEKLFADLDSAGATPDVVVYNASARARGPLIELDPAEVQNALTVSAFAGFLVAQAAVKRMLPKKHGAVLFTGASASVKGYAQSAPFAMGKFALRGLAQSMARELSAPGHPRRALRHRRRHQERAPARAARQAGFHARSRRHRQDLPAHPAAAAQRLDLGGRAQALGGAVLRGASRLCDDGVIAQFKPRLPPAPSLAGTGVLRSWSRSLTGMSASPPATPRRRSRARTRWR